MREIDAKGKDCPIPVILAKQAIAGGERDFTIEVDNLTAVENLRRLAGSQGFSAPVQEHAGMFCLHFLQETKPEPSPATPVAHRPYAVLVGRDIVGDGDRTLGTNLMRMFFYTLAQSDDLPACILFLNAGVKLPALDEQIVEHLAVLIGRGTEVLVCGTCLNFYSLTDQLQVGTVSNMYDLLTRMQGATKVISL